MNRFSKLFWLAKRNFIRGSVLNYGAMLISAVAALVFFLYFQTGTGSSQATGPARYITGLLFWLVMFLCFIALFMVYFLNSRLRYHEIGVLRALGARRSYILLLFYLETVLFSFSGLLIALAGGVLISKLAPVRFLAALQQLVPDWGLSSVFSSSVSAVVLALLISIAAVSYPAALSCKTEPYNAIRNRE